MVPQLGAVASPFGIEVCSSGGFDSLTDKHRIGRLWAGDQIITVLHLGDHDPSGVHVFSSLAEDIKDFAAAYGGYVESSELQSPRSRRTSTTYPRRRPKRLTGAASSATRPGSARRWIRALWRRLFRPALTCSRNCAGLPEASSIGRRCGRSSPTRIARRHAGNGRFQRYNREVLDQMRDLTRDSKGYRILR